MASGLEILDFSHAGMTPDPLSDAYQPTPSSNEWLERRTLAFGGSEIAPLLVAYDLAPFGGDYPEWVREQSSFYTAIGLPKLIAWKAGLRCRPDGNKGIKQTGANRERELYRRWRAECASQYGISDARKVRHADSVPLEWFPLVNRRCVRLAVTPDGWARDDAGKLVVLEIKCSFYGVAWVPWHYYMQLQAEMDAMNAARGLLIVGEHWVADYREDGPIKTFAVELDLNAIALSRAVANEAWALVESLRALAEAANESARVAKSNAAKLRAAKHARQECKRLWTESKSRMTAYGSMEQLHVSESIKGIDGLDEILSKQAMSV